MPAPELIAPPDLARAVDDAEYARLLGYPSRCLPPGAVANLALATRRWYARAGRPWVAAEVRPISALTDDTLELDDGTLLGSHLLAGRLRIARAEAVAVVAVSAGAEVDRESARHWAEERPDEAYFLDRFGAAVAEHLAAWSGRRLRDGTAGLSALPGYSPGYEGWSLTDQALLAACLTERASQAAPLEVLGSGAMRPHNSLLALFGLTGDSAKAAAAWRRHACSWCSLAGCSFRRPRVAAALPTT